MRKNPPIIIKERVKIPQTLVDRKRLYATHTKRFYDEARCAKCPLLSERHTSECNTCPHFQGELRMFRESERNGVAYYELPTGDLRQLEKVLNIDLSKALDKRASPKFRYPLKWTGKLRWGQKVDGVKTANQKRLTKIWLKKRRSGLIEAPPRTGKSVMSTYLACKVGLKTLIVAHQDELLKNFYKTFLRDTNLRQLRKKYKKRIVDIVKKDSDFADLDVCICTYQKFIRPDTGLKRIKKYLSGEFGIVFIDEAHQSGAAAYSRFLNELDAKIRVGLTATPKRPDKLHLLVEKIVGPVQVVAHSVAKVPELHIWETNIRPPNKAGYRSWPYAMKFLFNNKERNNMIVRQVFKDLRAGHQGIILPVDHLSHLNTLVKMINKQAAINRHKRGEKWPKKLAIPFHGKSDRKEVLSAIESGKADVLVAIRSMVKQGIDLRRPTALYIIVPMSNPSMFRQLAWRVGTPFTGKKQPIVRIMVDRLVQSSGCFRAVFGKEIRVGVKKQGDIPARYLMPAEELKAAIAIASLRDYHKKTSRDTAVEVKVNRGRNGRKTQVQVRRGKW